METVLEVKPVAIDGGRYPVVIGRGLCREIGQRLSTSSSNRHALVVFDAALEQKVHRDIIAPLVAAKFLVLPHAIVGGKASKSIHELLQIYGKLEEAEFSRDSTLIAVGGGVIGDMGGFAASTYLRGIQLVHVPTTLMAMIDSSIGGKVAINFRKTVNAVGNYYHPILNIMDLDWLDGLPQRDLAAGLAEAIKCGIICDPAFLDFLSGNAGPILSRSEVHLLKVISRCIDIKIEHVTGDVREGGKRLLLNYGHTLGHAIEISTERTDEEVYRHGEGVALGISAVAWIAEQFLKCDRAVRDQQESVLAKFGLPTTIRPSEIGFRREDLLPECLRNVRKDKKRKDNQIRLILAERIGKCAVYSGVPFEFIEDAFGALIKE